MVCFKTTNTFVSRKWVASTILLAKKWYQSPQFFFDAISWHLRSILVTGTRKLAFQSSKQRSLPGFFSPIFWVSPRYRSAGEAGAARAGLRGEQRFLCLGLFSFKMLHFKSFFGEGFKYHSTTYRYNNKWYCWWFRILYHLGCIKPVNNGINYLSTGAGFLPSTVLACFLCASYIDQFSAMMQ